MNSENMLLSESHTELKNILETHGSKTIMEYISFINGTVSDIDFSYFDTRMEEFFASYKQTLGFIFKESVVDRSIETLQKNRLISTADHQGVISHPFSLNGAYARSLYAQKVGQTSVVTFPCANISLSNSSFPRGLVVHDINEVERKIYFKSLLHKLNPVFCEAKVTKDCVQKMYDSLSSIPLPREAHKKVLSVFKNIFLSDAFLNLDSFDEQCAYGSFGLWKHIEDFQSIDLIYVSQEKIVTDLIIQKHLDKPTLIHALLFDETYRTLFVKYFDGIIGACNVKERKGTHFFWGVRDYRRVSLFVQGNMLVDEHGLKFIILEEKEIKKALLEKRIIPSMPLVFILLSFYYGFVCGGGFSQVDYLGQMKSAWMRILQELGNTHEANQVEKIPTNIYIADFAFLKNSHNHLLTSVDFITVENPTKITITLFEAYKNLEPMLKKIVF